VHEVRKNDLQNNPDLKGRDFLRLLVGEKVTIDNDHLNRQKMVPTMTKKVADQG